MILLKKNCLCTCLCVRESKCGCRCVCVCVCVCLCVCSLPNERQTSAADSKKRIRNRRNVVNGNKLCRYARANRHTRYRGVDSSVIERAMRCCYGYRFLLRCALTCTCWIDGTLWWNIVMEHCGWMVLLFEFEYVVDVGGCSWLLLLLLVWLDDGQC